MVDELTEKLARAGFQDLNPAHHPVFENIDPGGTRLTDLAERAGITHQSMGELVAALVAKDYLERRSDPSDGRARLVCLTAKGRRLVRQALQEIASIEGEWADKFGEIGLGSLKDALGGAIERLDEEREPGRTL
jgi:DNA-binding MarR family transcriptional regulator